MADLAGWCHAAGMYEQPSPRRIGPGLIAMLALLGAVAGTMAYLVTRQMLADRSVLTATPPRTSSPVVTASPADREPDDRPDHRRPRPGTHPHPRAGPEPRRRRGVLSEAHRRRRRRQGPRTRSSRLLLYVEFTNGRRTGRAWICRNADDVLVYQAHERSSAFDAADNGINTLLLAEGVKGTVVEVDGGYRASNPGPGGGLFRVHGDRRDLHHRPAERSGDLGGGGQGHHPGVIGGSPARPGRIGSGRLIRRSVADKRRNQHPSPGGWPHRGPVHLHAREGAQGARRQGRPRRRDAGLPARGQDRRGRSERRRQVQPAAHHVRRGSPEQR